MSTPKRPWLISTLVLVFLGASGCGNGSHTIANDKNENMQLTVKVAVNMQLGNLIQKNLSPGTSVIGLCFVPRSAVPDGYPGSAVKVRSGETIGYALVQDGSKQYFDASAKAMENGLPTCSDVDL